MAGALFVLPKQVAIDSGGLPVPSAKAYFYLTGSTTPTNTYQNIGLSTAHANPVQADSAGVFPPIWLNPSVATKLKLTDENDTLIYEVDPLDVSGDYPRLSQNNTFLGQQTISGGGAELTLRGATNDAAVQAYQRWQYLAGGDIGYFGFVNGASYDLSLVNNVADADIKISTLGGAGAITLNGVDVTSYAQIALDTAANLGSAAATINTANKFAGRLVLDTTNHKIYSARGANATDPWDLADGSASVTPS